MRHDAHGQATIGGLIDTAAISAPFAYRERGLYALDPDMGEILYIYGNSGENSILLEPNGTETVIDWLEEFVVSVGNASFVTANVVENSHLWHSPVWHICDIFVSEGECFHHWELYTSENALIQPPDELLFKNAFLTKIPSNYTFDLNINKLSLYAPREYMGNWNAEKDLYTDGLYLLNSGNKSMILTGR